MSHEAACGADLRLETLYRGGQLEVVGAKFDVLVVHNDICLRLSGDTSFL